MSLKWFVLGYLFVTFLIGLYAAPVLSEIARRRQEQDLDFNDDDL